MDKCKCEVCECKFSELKDIKESQEIIDKVNSGKKVTFGLVDILGSICGSKSYFPCEFVEVVDYDKGLIKVYEESIKKYHVDLASNLLAYY